MSGTKVEVFVLISPVSGNKVSFQCADNQVAVQDVSLFAAVLQEEPIAHMVVTKRIVDLR